MPRFLQKIGLFRSVERRVRWALGAKTYVLKPIQELLSSAEPEIVYPRSKHVIADSSFLANEGLQEKVIVSSEFFSPKISAVHLTDVEVIGWTDFIVKNGTAFYPDDANPEDDVFIAELEARGVYFEEQGKIRILTSSRTVHAKKAVSLLGQSSTNYAHWISEVLPKLLLVRERINTIECDLLIDADLHENQLSSMASLGLQWKNIYFIRPWQHVKIQELFYVTPAAYTPADSRVRFKTGNFALPSNRSFFSPALLDRVREVYMKSANTFDDASRVRRVIRMQEMKIRWQHREPLPSVRRRKVIRLKAIETAKLEQLSRSMEQRFNPRRILFLRSPSSHNGRHCENLSAIIPVLEDFGFCRIVVDTLTFDEQVALMSDVECVVSLMGASLANLAFAPAGTKVAILSPYYENGDYSYFRHFMAALKHKSVFVLGHQIPKLGRTKLTSNYKIETSVVRDALNLLLAPVSREN